MVAEPMLAEPSRKVTTPAGTLTALVTTAERRTVWLASMVEGAAVRTVCVAYVGGLTVCDTEKLREA